MSEIPLDLLVEILIRLPGKYLARFKCVSKQWSSLISSPYFCESVYTITQRKQQPRLYMCLVGERGQSALLSMSSTSPDNTCFVVDQDLSIPGMGCYYLNDLHGLMCFTVGKKACLYNPSTGQRLTLPKIKADIIADKGQTRYISRYSFGYDSKLEVPGKKVVSHKNYRPHAPFSRGQSISGSVVHYLAWHDMYTCAIVSFDVRSEELTTIIAPEDVMANMSVPAIEMKAELIDYGGKIAIFECSYLKTEGMAVLLVLEDAEKKEWSKRSLVLQPCQRHLVQDTEFIVKGTTQDGKVILAPLEMHSGFYILCYDLQSNGLSKVEIQGVPHRWFDEECYYDLRLMSESERVIYLET
ncbi:F-box/LRR-repeat protein [Raphanus sativus]|nr:F-box/LRR-repeat protein [Raphanus sativus]